LDSSEPVDELLENFPQQDAEELIGLIDSILKGDADIEKYDRFQDVYTRLGPANRSILLAHLLRKLQNQSVEETLG